MSINDSRMTSSAVGSAFQRQAVGVDDRVVHAGAGPAGGKRPGVAGDPYVTAGSFLSVADKVLKCRSNAAPLRPDVASIVVRNADGTEVMRSTWPERRTPRRDARRDGCIGWTYGET